MRQPACAEGEPVRRTARDRMHPVRRTHRILSHWQRATAHTGSGVEKEEDIQAALDEARTYTDAPTIIEFMISTDEIVLPMVKSGNPMSEMILK